jgi:hypothetical protein
MGLMDDPTPATRSTGSLTLAEVADGSVVLFGHNVANITRTLPEIAAALGFHRSAGYSVAGPKADGLRAAGCTSAVVRVLTCDGETRPVDPMSSAATL